MQSSLLCHSPRTPTTTAVNRYVDSIQRILEYIGLPVPTTHAFITPIRGNAHLLQHQLPGSPAFPSMETAVAWYLSDDHVPCNVYLQHEKSDAWCSFIKSLPPRQRHEASVRRCITMMFFSTMRRIRCVYCWLPTPSCICSDLEKMREELLRPLEEVAVVTMLLHCEELLRTTNTGHIAAFILDSEIRVWGIADDDAWLAQVERHVQQPSAVSASVVTTHPVLLYPEEGAQLVSDVDFSVLHLSDGADPLESVNCPTITAPQPSSVHRLHIILSDGTWPQAHRVNRHVPRSIPRVALKIDESYESLFASLRKQTRTTGVSTLEATALAVAQRMTALGQTTHAALVEQHLLATMKRFVDIVCVDKRQEPVFDLNDASALKQRRQEHHHQMMETERVAGRRNDDIDRTIPEDLFRRFCAPPVLSYCYICEMYVGWSRMPGHVVGARHRQLVEPLAPEIDVWSPTEKSRSADATNIHVLQGNPVPLQA
jgi:DTW domain-containing protein YfiP